MISFMNAISMSGFDLRQGHNDNLFQQFFWGILGVVLITGAVLMFVRDPRQAVGLAS